MSTQTNSERNIFSRISVLSAMMLMASLFLSGCGQSREDLKLLIRSDYKATAPGFVTNMRIGKMWMRCAVGQEWDESNQTCTGDIQLFTLKEALALPDKFNAGNGFGNFKNWRLPTIRELHTLRFCAKGENKRFYDDFGDGLPNPIVPSQCNDVENTTSIDTTLFPNPRGNYYLSSSVNRNISGSWHMEFAGGRIEPNLATFPILGQPARYTVRLIRDDIDPNQRKLKR